MTKALSTRSKLEHSCHDCATSLVVGPILSCRLPRRSQTTTTAFEAEIPDGRPRQTLLDANGQSGVRRPAGVVDKKDHGNTGQFASDPRSADDHSARRRAPSLGRNICWPDLGHPNRRGCSRVGESAEALYLVAKTGGGSTVRTLVERARKGLRDWAAHHSSHRYAETPCHQHVARLLRQGT